MSISKIQFKASAQATPVVWMDVTQDTVEAAHLETAYTAHDASGTQITGTLEPGGGPTYTWEKIYEGNISLDGDWGNGHPYGGFPSYESIPLNSVWRITWDNVQYICTATWGSTDGDLYAIGNYLYEAGGSGGNNEPFFMQGYGGPSVWYVVGNQVGSHSVIVEKQVEAPPGLEYETGTWTPTEDVASYVIPFANTHTEAPYFYLVADTGDDYYSENNTNFFLMYCNNHQIFGNPLYESTNSIHYGEVRTMQRAGSATSFTNGTIMISEPYTSSLSSSVNHSRYWATETGIKAYTNGASRYWRFGRTYKWIAVWKPTT